MPRKRLGELLLEQGTITAQQLQSGLALQRQSGNRLGAALVAQGVLTEEKLAQALATALGLQIVDLDKVEVEWSALHALRDRFCEANDLFPVSLEPGKTGRTLLTVAMADPLNLPAIEEIEFTTAFKVSPRLATLSQVRNAIRRHYLRLPPEDAAPKDAPLRPVSEEVVLTDAMIEPPAGPTKPVPPPARPKPDVTARTALAELIREHEEKAKASRPSSGGNPIVPAPLQRDLEYLTGERILASDPMEQLERMESRLWALLRLMAKKGVLTREEFLEEFGE